MKSQESTKKVIGVSILSAIAASLCCITPALALLAGSSGLASTFSFMEPVRPYLIALTVIVLGFAWYKKLKPRKIESIECACDEEEKKTPFMQGKFFLSLVTLFAAAMLAFPYYSKVFYPETYGNATISESATIEVVRIDIKGMTCTSCESHLKFAVSQVLGFIEASADYSTGKVSVTFDKTKTSIDSVISTIDETGYKVTNYEIDK
ncbi:mercuric transport protein MerTP [Ancylomarina sp. DW003]|nr:mercuric transport protein MerTP [Ancylomarina sp. DW003]MDE5421025.1 mercuric transport protein MerTP [Ancylomarina sp. DW003]